MATKTEQLNVGDRVLAIGTGSNYTGCTGTVAGISTGGVEVHWDSVPHPALPLTTLHSPAYLEKL